MRTVAILAVLGYRLIPVPVRLLWSASDGGSSGKDLAALRSGAPIEATFRKFAVPRFRSCRVWEPPSWDN